uniref:Small GTP-binding protein n=1 Tax=Plectus sambesii TaxID=2011161 RepID=A0A914VLH1_9BILA
MNNYREQLTSVRAKVVVVGATGVGKTSIIMRQDNHEFATKLSPTLGASFISTNVQVDGQTVEMQLWDTAGQERFRSMVPMYLRNAAGAFIVYDMTALPTFNDLPAWMEDLNRWTDQPLKICILANKSDLASQRQVTAAEGAAFAESFGAHFYETSALNGNGIEQCFRDMAHALLVKKEDSADASILTLSDRHSGLSQRENKQCC